MIATLALTWLIARLSFMAVELIGSNVYEVLLIMRGRKRPRAKKLEAMEPGFLNVIHHVAQSVSHRQEKFYALIGLSSTKRPRPGSSRGLQGVLGEYHRYQLSLVTAVVRRIKALFKSRELAAQAKGFGLLLVSIWQGLVLVVEPVMVGYFVYLAATDRTNSLLLLLIAAVTLAAAFVIWTDERRKPKDKLYLSFFLPMFWVLYACSSIIRAGILLTSETALEKPRNPKSTQELLDLPS